MFSENFLFYPSVIAYRHTGY